MLLFGGLARLRATAQSCLTSSQTSDKRAQMEFSISARESTQGMKRGEGETLRPRLRKLKHMGSMTACERLTTNLDYQSLIMECEDEGAGWRNLWPGWGGS